MAFYNCFLESVNNIEKACDDPDAMAEKNRMHAGIGGLEHCHKLLQCFAEAVRCMAAVTALFFMLFVVGIVLLMLTGGG